jgi:hypothetical protein
MLPGVGRRIVIAVGVVLVCMGALAATASAKLIIRAQNPDLVVRVQIWPRHPKVGDTIVARVRIRNTTGHRLLDAQVGDTWQTPTGGQGGAIAGALGKGVIWWDVFRYKVTAATPKGRFVLEGDAFDRRGDSHAAVAVTLR